MRRLLRLAALVLCCTSSLPLAAQPGKASSSAAPWTFAVSGDSRNCGDFVMPAIAAHVKAEHDAFYWHMGDFRWGSKVDQDLAAMQPADKPLTLDAYHAIEWDDFIHAQLDKFAPVPVYLSRGNHEAIPPMTRDGYIAKFMPYLSQPAIVAQRKADGAADTPIQPWFHWVRNGIDFVSLDNADKEEFTAEQMAFVRKVLDRDLAKGSGIKTIVLGMHEALPNSLSSNHAMDDWPEGVRSGEQVYEWLLDAQAKGLRVYLLASHSHYFAVDIYNTPYWRPHGGVLPGWIIGTAGAHRYNLPAAAHPPDQTHVYGYLRGTAQPSGVIDFALVPVSEEEMYSTSAPGSPKAAIDECYQHNDDPPAKNP